MSEADTIKRTEELPTPATVETLAADLRALGLKPGMTALVHSSLSKFGWVSGGAVAVIMALEDVLTRQGTLVMPTHSADLSDPARWENPPVPEVWWQAIRDTMPAYQPDLTPTRGMGIIPETFRKQAGVLRSNHPAGSFAAWGSAAASITARHPLPIVFGDESPLARIYDHDGWVLLLGVGHGNNTSLHLSEWRADFPAKTIIRCGAPILLEGQREWAWYDDLDYNDDDFPQIGAAYAAAGGEVYTGRVAQADCILCPQRPLIDFGVQWIEANRA